MNDWSDDDVRFLLDYPEAPATAEGEERRDRIRAALPDDDCCDQCDGTGVGPHHGSCLTCQPDPHYPSLPHQAPHNDPNTNA
jgi:hypothetical protein